MPVTTKDSFNTHHLRSPGWMRKERLGGTAVRADLLTPLRTTKRAPLGSGHDSLEASAGGPFFRETNYHTTTPHVLFDSVFFFNGAGADNHQESTTHPCECRTKYHKYSSAAFFFITAQT